MKFSSSLFLQVTTFCVIAGLLAPQVSLADIVVVGSTTSYQETGGDWLSSGTNDIDGNGGLGSDGYLFFGNFNGVAANGQAFGNDVRNTPGYVSGFSAGTGFDSIADEFPGYGQIDDPSLVDGTNTLGGIATGLGTGAVAGRVVEVFSFDISGLAEGQTVRVGLLSGIEGQANGRWDPTSITLSDGVNAATIGDHNLNQLAINPGGTNAGWVFFDIDANGTYGVSGTARLATQGVSFGGITFDSITVVPEPGFMGFLALMGSLLTLRRRNN